ncbi:MAG: L-histidine N(alpha)-methyltransferase [Myxococcales bacterium]|nr:L-histidine N(alpha)-methyltransferase [Myxococcota bacterium]MDW8280989.1 L-histidine N(alpha)-methyltransferase [Myxococcales bacterium]
MTRLHARIREDQETPGLLQKLGQVIRERREQAGLSRAALALRAGLSESTLKNLEAGRHQPTRTTLMQLCSIHELKLNMSDLLPLSAAESEAGPPLNCWLAPGFDPIAMAQDLTTRLSGRGGHIEQTFLYLDTKSAACWCAIVNHVEHLHGLRESLPLRDVASKIHECVGSAGLDLIGLGCGDGREEVRLAQFLLQQAEPHDLRLYLLDISQPLLGFAYKHAADTLADRRGVAVFAIQGDFHRLPCYTQLLYTPQRAHRRRIVCMFGGTFGNLENEIRFLRNSLVGFAPGDLLLLHVSLVHAPADRPHEIMQRDPRLSGRIPPDLAQREREWLIGPIERYARPAGAPLCEQVIHCALDTTSCTLPGSYAVETIITVKSADGEVRRFSMEYIKRYDPHELSNALRQLGWEPIAAWTAGTPYLLGLFRWQG